ncbi:hypothetical protein L218DRAFT_878847 [Marasmius fiardii PR-910]|nr:hypothetical protein L218DRAFT_878847 [Marasmius fiardii PR-910]
MKPPPPPTNTDENNYLIRPLLKNGLVGKLVRVIAISTRLLSCSPITNRSVTMLVAALLMSCQIIETFVTRGLSWVIEALDGNLLAEMIRLPPEYLQARASHMLGALTITEAYTSLISTIKPFVYFRSVVHRIFRNLKKVTTSGTLEGDSMLSKNPITREVYELECLARGMNKRMHEIGQGLPLCSNANCPTRHTTQTQIWNQCYQCRVAIYCSRDCQKVDWKRGHRVECKQSPTPKHGLSYSPSRMDEIFIHAMLEANLKGFRSRIEADVRGARAQSQIMVAYLNWAKWPPSYTKKPLEEQIKEHPEQSEKLKGHWERRKHEADVVVHVELPGEVWVFHSTRVV